MKKYIEKNINLILSVFILIQPILDLITGISLHMFKTGFTLGIVIRMLFLLLMVYITVFVYEKKKVLYYYGIVFIYFILYVVDIYLFKNNQNILGEIQGFLRTFYFPLLLISLYQIKDKIRISNMLLFTTLTTYLILIFIPLLTNMGYKTYEITKSGTLGFFNSANEISGIISILTPIIFLMFNTKRKFILKLIFCIIYVTVILMIGTKTPLLTLIITCLVALIYLIRKSLKLKKYNIITLLIITMIIGTSSIIMVIPKTNFYKNIQVHLNYLKVDNILDIFKDEKLVDHFIFSQRLTFMKKTDKIYKKSNSYQKLVGIGYINSNNKKNKQIEMDYFDIYYNHGIIGFIIFFSCYLYVLVNIFRNKIQLNYDNLMKYLSLILIIILSLFTGHIITAPSVSIIVSILLINLLPKSKKRLLFTAHSLDIGGIETALINLLDKINYNKYDVVIILEKKQGVLLNKVNKKVSIIEYKVNNNQNILIRKCKNYFNRIKYLIFNYHTYDFSCCYATYSYSGNVVARISSINNSIYVHSNYKHLYKTKEFINFFDSRQIKEFKHIFFVSNESCNDFLKIYPNLKQKTLVINNFINISKIIKLSMEKIEISKSESKKLFVFVGRLDDSSKKLSRLINLGKQIKNIEIWIVGDGPDKEKYFQEVEKYNLKSKVKFLGRKENPYPYMKKADYIILTSDYEGFPVIYLESIVLDKRIITTIPVSDDEIDIKKYADIISKDKDRMVIEVSEIINKKSTNQKLDLEYIQNKRIQKLEKIFDEVT